MPFEALRLSPYTEEKIISVHDYFSLLMLSLTANASVLRGITSCRPAITVITVQLIVTFHIQVGFDNISVSHPTNDGTGAEIIWTLTQANSRF